MGSYFNFIWNFWAFVTVLGQPATACRRVAVKPHSQRSSSQLQWCSITKEDFSFSKLCISLHVFSTKNLVYWFIQIIFVHSGGVLSFIFIEHEFHLPIVCRGITQFSINLLETLCFYFIILAQEVQLYFNKLTPVPLLMTCSHKRKVLLLY